jgi:hypothetical protein
LEGLGESGEDEAEGAEVGMRGGKEEKESATESAMAVNDTNNNDNNDDTNNPTLRFSPTGFPPSSSGGGAQRDASLPTHTTTIPPVWDWV